MKILNPKIYKMSYEIISQMFGDGAEFREGQYEAIEATLLNRRTLIVQKTGWGKSLVYFICTKLFRIAGKGVTIIVSPLLVLMENQLEAAAKMGLKCDVLNSTVKERRDEIIESLVTGSLDLVLITPETLLGDAFLSRIKDINIGFFVIDEAHCISDWWHDFRLKYTQLSRVIKIISPTIPILATTATANNRVVEDLATQLGGSVHISRGSLMRESLSIQIIDLPDTAQRYAWILQNINSLAGSGIIYCLTRRDCDYLSDFLQKNHINVLSYYSRSDAEEHLNKKAEQLFKENKIKALISTIKLGMGYDKGDIAFIIHFQHPSNIVSYYQQIGRAGRSIPRAYTFLMHGKEDKKIQDYFIDTAFPTRGEAKEIIEYIHANNENGAQLGEITANVNCRYGRIGKALMFLENEGFIYKEKSKYFRTLKEFAYNDVHYDAITQIRRKEQSQMLELIETTGCYSKFVVNCLDDFPDYNCGKCANCLAFDEYPSRVDTEFLEAAQLYIERLVIPIEPRKQWATTSLTRRTKIAHQNEVGICISKYGDPGYGMLVKEGKYSSSQFSEQLVGKSASELKGHIEDHGISAITCVPSLRSNIVEDFAIRLAKRLNKKFITLLQKSDAEQQKFMLNTSYQCENALKSFSVIENADMPESVLLVDDIVDSGWTLAVCGYKLMDVGCKKVFPFALADSSRKEE